VNGQGSQATDAEALAAAVRPIRLAAASLANPLVAAVGLVAGADAVTATLSKVPAVASHSPFGPLGAVAGAAAGGSAPPEPSKARRSRTPHGGAAGAVDAAGAAGGAVGAGAAAGKAVGKAAAALLPGATAGTVSATGKAAGAAVGRAGAAAGAAIGAAAAGRMAAAAGGAAGAAAGKAAAGAAAERGAPATAGAQDEDCCPTLLDLVEKLVEDVERLDRAEQAAPTRRERRVATTPGGGARAGIAMDDVAGRRENSVSASKAFLGEGGALPEPTLDRHEDIAVRRGDGPTLKPSPVAEPAAAPSGGSIFESLRRALLTTGFDAATAPAPPTRTAHGSATVSPPTPPGGPVPIPYPNVSVAAPVAPGLEPDDLAWLVNEALVEQARRHGVDLS
jgi:hypothetical protein